jgi:hypothetical protein
MKLITIVCGGRDSKDSWSWREFFHRTQTNLVIAGGARGADTIAVFEADHAGIEIKVIKADWERFGKSAGFKRNVAMAEYAKSVVEEFGGAVQVVGVRGGVGTKHMMETGKAFGFKVCYIDGSEG